EVAPVCRFRDGGRLLTAIESCEAGGELPHEDGLANEGKQPLSTRQPVNPSTRQGGPSTRQGKDDDLFREARRLLAGKAFDQVIDRLDVYRPPEWAVVDARGARVLRLLGQADLGPGDVHTAPACPDQPPP